MSTVDDPTSALDRLVRAMGRLRHRETCEAYRACYELGGIVIPGIFRKVRAANWRNLGSGRRGKLRYLTGLMLLLRDLDESASRALADEILRKPCHPVVAARLRSIKEFTLDDFELKPGPSLPIYISKHIPRRDSVWRHVQAWLGCVAPEDLARINRLYIIERNKQSEFWGLYVRFFANITLVWRPYFEWNRPAVLSTEFTLYHEIGHHVDPRDDALREELEAFADDYARRRFGEAHPILAKSWVGALLLPSLAAKSKTIEDDD